MKPSEDNIKLGKNIAAAIGLEPHVYPYFDQDNKNMIYILDCKDPLDNNIKFYSTICVSDAFNEIEMKDNSFKDIRVEILMMGNNSTDKWGNILSTTGFYITKNSWSAEPGTIFKNILNEYVPDVHLPHILFTRPFPWGEKLSEPMILESKNVHFLLAIPVSDTEANFLDQNGYSALEKLFLNSDADIHDINRPSVV